MAAVYTPPDVAKEKTTPNQDLPLGLPGIKQVPQEKLGASFFGSILRGAALITFAAGALTLFSFALNPVVFVTLVLLAFALSPLILLGLAIVFTQDIQRDEVADTSRQPCSCHHDRLESTFAKR